MQIILLEKVKNLGDLGSVVDVRAGYGRNFLIPQGKALPATKDNLATVEARRAELQAQAAHHIYISPQGHHPTCAQQLDF